MTLRKGNAAVMEMAGYFVGTRPTTPPLASMPDDERRRLADSWLAELSPDATAIKEFELSLAHPSPARWDVSVSSGGSLIGLASRDHAEGAPMVDGKREHATVELETQVLLSRILQADEVIARLDGVINLLTKASKVIDRGEPGDRAKALALIHRAEGSLPDERDFPEEHRSIAADARESLRSASRQALAMPE